ncbi:MAG: dihydrofolate reductase [Pseudonocardia sp.]|uniref:dihydrofolate reductase family protein n=1 Tax=unclassified Pseudonocardia TaxID=2619320 RepID=UPI00086B95BF|nr:MULTISPECIES: dihydrofolate reductase family protein [unclassified Pseudonocardia]MBN9109810.1 dihydrofolate reductase [Pseudonocardia sp.]ODU23256.1 MAG: deaminase [Pseudonocardia sp. SCN 72-51]ODV09211.1 MAG: deaminase [Pseudonocardia sp. SCN 73-27]
MGALKVHEFITLDGCIGAPMWTMEYPFTDEMMASVGALTGSATALLFGRTTWVEMGPAWSGRSMEDDPGVPFFNNTAKYVVSGTLTSAEGWNNSHLLGAYDADAIRKLKVDNDGDVYVSGSGTLVRAMLADGLVDELHLFVYPVALGTGPKLFPEGTENTLTLLGCESYTNQVVHLTYGPRA